MLTYETTQKTCSVVGPPVYLGSRDDENSKNHDEIAKYRDFVIIFAISSSFFEFSSAREPKYSGGGIPTAACISPPEPIGSLTIEDCTNSYNLFPTDVSPGLTKPIFGFPAKFGSE